MTERPIVCHIITKLELGGAQQNTLFTVAHLDPAKFRPVLITGEEGLLDEEARKLRGVEYHQIPCLVRQLHPVKDFQALITLTRLLKKIRPIVVQTHSSKAGILGRLAAWLAGVPIIIHSIHGFGFHPHQHAVTRQLFVWLEKIVAPVTTYFFAVSHANREAGVRLGLFTQDRVKVIRSGVDLSALKGTRVDVPAKRRELGLDPGRPVVGMVAAFKPQKAPLDFIRTAEVVYKARPDAQFVLVGDGELRTAIESKCIQLGLSQAVRLTGWRRDIPELLRCLDVFVLTSLWEGLPRVYLEALASGVPVVGTQVDGAEEVIRDDHNGFLVEPGDVARLAARVQYLLSYPEEARRMGQRGMEISEEFDIWEMVRQQEREYGMLLTQMSSLTAERSIAGHAVEEVVPIKR